MQGVKKIGLFLGANPGNGGMFQYSLAILEAMAGLPRDDYRVIVASFNPAWRAHVEPLGLQLILLGTSNGRERFTLGRIWRTMCLPLAPWKKFLWRLDPVARALYKGNEDLWIFPAQDHWGYLAPVKSLVSIHDLMHRFEPEFPEVSRWGRYFIREYRFRNICSDSCAVLVDSEVGRKQVIESYALSKERVFPLPYIPPGYIYSNDMPKGFDLRHSLPSKFVFYPAQFWPHKNHERLLQAIALISNELPDIKLVLSGPKRLGYKRLTRRINDLGINDKVYFIGYVDNEDLPEIYRRARALIMPTIFGPTNLPPLEAFVQGCPVAVSDIYGIPEQVGDAALLFNPLSINEMAKVIRKLWVDENICKILAKRGRKKIKEWSKKEFNHSLKSIIFNLLEKR